MLPFGLFQNMLYTLHSSCVLGCTVALPFIVIKSVTSEVSEERKVEVTLQLMFKFGRGGALA